MNRNRERNLRFGISSLLLVTVVVAVIVAITLRFVHDPSPTEISFNDLELDSAQIAVATSQTLPSSIKNLHHRRVRIRGYIHPQSVFREKGIRRFFLCRDNSEHPDAVNDDDFIVVQMVGSAKTDFVSRPVAVTGQFKILDPPLVRANRKLFYEIAAVTCDD